MYTRIRVRRLLSAYLAQACRREGHRRSLGPPAFRLQGGLPSLDTARSRTDTYTRPSACNHPPRSPSFPRMTFRLSCCADSGTEAGRYPPPVGLDGCTLICPLRLLVSSFADNCIPREREKERERQKERENHITNIKLLLKNIYIYVYKHCVYI